MACYMLMCHPVDSYVFDVRERERETNLIEQQLG